MNKRLIWLIGAAALIAAPAAAAEKLKIGFITTLSGPAGIIGKHMKDSFELGLDHVDRKVGGLETEVIYGDDQRKPDVGKQIADKMIKRDRVDFVSGVIWSNVMLAVHGPITKSETIFVGANAGPHQIAGKRCSKYYFSTSWQNDQTPEAMGKYMQDKGIDDVYIMAPNYAAGKDMLSGFKRYFKGAIAAEIYTKLGQQDYAAEITQIRAANPKAVFVFYPGGMGIQFVKQYAQAGLREKIPLYSVYTSDALTLPAQQAAALGNFETRFWSPDLQNPMNRRFVSEFRKKYGYTPSFYGAQSYDAVMTIDAAVRAVGGNLDDKEGMIAALRKAEFSSVRGSFKYNSNHFPIQNFYLLKVVKDDSLLDVLKDEKHTYATKIQGIVFSAHKDAYAQECPMKW